MRFNPFRKRQTDLLRLREQVERKELEAKFKLLNKEVKKVDLNDAGQRQDIYKGILGSGRSGHMAHGKK